MHRRRAVRLLGIATLAATFFLVTAATAQQAPSIRPSLEEQLAQDHVIPGTALDRLIRDHQDFSSLDPREAVDTLGLPPWLRLVWRRGNPTWRYRGDDPTGGYPHVLKEVREWMRAHQDLQAPPDQPGAGPSPESTAGSDLRISGAQTDPRSESDIRINYWNASQVISASNNIGGNGRQAVYASSDGGATWTSTTLPLTTGDASHSDPTVDWTSNGTAWSGTIGINNFGTVLKIRWYKSTDGGLTWTFDSTASGSQGSTDKPMTWVDHSASSPYKDYAYGIWHNGAPAYMNRKNGPGGTWNAAPTQVSGSETTGTAIGGDVKTNANGDVFGFWPDTGSSKLYMVKSTNGGTSYSAPARIASTYDSYDIGIPAMNNRRALIYVSGGAYRNGTKNDVYAAWTDQTGVTGCNSPANEPGGNVSSTCKTRIWFARSLDGGTTWGAPVMLNNQASLNDQFNQWLAVDETTGRISVMYYDTVNDPGRKKTDVWYQTSSDDGATWSAPIKLTSGMTDETVSGADLGNQYGDYNGLTGYANKFMPSWTDRRSGGYEEIWSAPVTEGNPCTPPAAPTGVTATANGTLHIDVLWSLVAGATEYHVLRSTTSGGPYAQIAVVPDPGHSYADTNVTGGTTYYYVVRAYAGCESGNSSEAFATAIGPACTTKTLYTNGFESGSGLSDWTVGTFGGSGGTTNWRGIQSCSAETGTHIFRFGGNNCNKAYTNGNFAYAAPLGSTGIAFPAGASSSRLVFGHRRAFGTNDGGTLRVSLDGANWTAVPASAIVTGATYNGSIGGSCPPAGSAGANVFTGTQSTFVDTTVDLDAVCNAITGTTGGCAGRSVWIAFTAITDCSGTASGWFLDNVQVTTCAP